MKVIFNDQLYIAELCGPFPAHQVARFKNPMEGKPDFVALNTDPKALEAKVPNLYHRKGLFITDLNHDWEHRKADDTIKYHGTGISVDNTDREISLILLKKV